MYYVEGDVKVKGHCRVTGKYRGSAYSDCNIKVKSQNSYRIPQHRIMTHILLCKNYTNLILK